MKTKETQLAFLAWEGEVIQHISDRMGLTTSDAQAIIDVYPDAVQKAFLDGMGASDAAQLVDKASDEAANRNRERGS